MVDRQEITDLLIRYATALDTRNWELLSTCFAPDAAAVYEGFGEFRSYPAIEAACRGALTRLDASQHVVSNVVIGIDGDSAAVSCYLVAQHTRAGGPGGDNYTIGGTYSDEMMRTPLGWRIKHRRLTVTWSDGNPRVLGL